MEPTIQDTTFGRITVGGETYDHDVVIGLDGGVRQRKKKLSKKVYGTSHKLSLAEAQDVYQPGAKRLIVGTGQYGALGLSAEAQAFFKAQGCDVIQKPTPQALQDWNQAGGETIGLFHITC